MDDNGAASLLSGNARLAIFYSVVQKGWQEIQRQVVESPIL